MLDGAFQLGPEHGLPGTVVVRASERQTNHKPDTCGIRKGSERCSPASAPLGDWRNDIAARSTSPCLTRTSFAATSSHVERGPADRHPADVDGRRSARGVKVPVLPTETAISSRS